MKILITGAAGFIGYHTSKKFIENNFEVLGIDNLNNYYDVNLKFSRLENLGIYSKNIKYGSFVNSAIYKNFQFTQLNIEDTDSINELFKQERFDFVCNLAAQAGVRYSINQPYKYLDSNIYGFLNILESCRNFGIKHLVYASSSSVYGLNTKMPFSVNDNVDHPISLYAVSKKTNELMAHSYSYLYRIPTTGLRLFTVYGPWGRPDMSFFLFTKAILSGEPINIFNQGDMLRDFTYVDDVVEGFFRIINKIPHGAKSQENIKISESTAPYKIYNIGNNNPVKLIDFIEEIERAIGKTAEKIFLPMQAGDVQATYADVENFVEITGYKPSMSIREGIKNFVDWYRKYYNL